jgi:ABC-type glycerol-3-phosphate transport system substrate-binding protein
VNRTLVVSAALLATAGLSACGSSPKSASSDTTTTAPAATTTNATTTATATTTPAAGKAGPTAKLILKLLKAPQDASLPASLQGSQTQAAQLSSGSRARHAAGAIVTTNGGALVGYLVFKNRKDALADLAAYPPNSGPNKIVARSVPGLPKPTYVLRARGNAYLSRYIVFVDGPVIVNTWAYGQEGKEAALKAVVLSNAHWARGRLEAARKAIG